MRITLTNDFHRTSVNLNAKDGRLSPGQVKRAKRELCGMADCTCSGPTGERGPQSNRWDDKHIFILCETYDGGAEMLLRRIAAL